MTAGVMQVLKGIGRFDVDVGLEEAFLQADFHIQEDDAVGGGLPSEFKVGKILERLEEGLKFGGGVSPDEENVINIAEPAEGFRGLSVEEGFLQASHEQVGIGGGHTGSHGRSLDLEVVLAGTLEVVFFQYKLAKLEKEGCGWFGVFGSGTKEMFKGGQAMGMGNVGVEGGGIHSDKDRIRW